MQDKFPQISYYQIPFLTLKELTDSDMKIRISNVVKICIWDNDIETAWKLREKLLKLLSSAGNTLPQHLYKYYDEQITLLSYVVIPRMQIKEIEVLFRNSLLLAIKNEVDVIQSVKSYYLYYQDPEHGYSLATSILRVLGLNREILGNNNITIDEEGSDLPPTVANWLKLYNSQFSLSGARGILEEGQFLQSNKEVLKLNTENKKVLSKLIRFYDFLRFPQEFANKDVTVNEARKTEATLGDKVAKLSDLAEATQQSNDKEIESISEKVDSKNLSPEEQEILDAYKGDPKQAKAIMKEAKKINSKFGGDIPRLRAEFFAAVQKKNVNRTIALLRILTQKHELENFIAKDEKLNKFLTNIWQKQYGDDFIREFSKKPDQLKFTKIFLRYILEQRLGLSSSDAARIGLQIANVFVSSGKKSYNKMAYFDVKTKTFKWID